MVLKKLQRDDFLQTIHLHTFTQLGSSFSEKERQIKWAWLVFSSCESLDGYQDHDGIMWWLLCLGPLPVFYFFDCGHVLS